LKLPAATLSWIACRALQVGVLLVVVVLPMLISRDLTMVARYSKISVLMMLALAATIAGLAVLAVAQVGWMGFVRCCCSLL
jgi:hypothetical protein